MTIEPGARLGHYEVVEAIGAGGMGEVYRARDTKLHREVAIKILSTSLAPVPERLARFEREAHLLAALNHPNIATIHGLEKDRGIDFIVLELVEGETLAERIARGPIPLDEALLLFDQIAHGLEAAHEKGIIHRDLKPPNVKITPDGHVKILDFGLGKVFEDTEAAQADPSLSPTLTRDGSHTGVILGTPAYMSPEQARAEPVDKRADIWAFGACLYEALTGKPAFAGTSAMDILASVMRAEPDWTRLPAETPFLVRRVLERCLDKDLRRRFHDIVDARIDLEDATTATITPPTSSGLLRWALLGILLAGIGGLVSWLWPRPSPARPVTRAEIATEPLNVFNYCLAVSRDGTKIAYMTADRQIYVRYMDRDVVLALPNAENATKPVFSPDGEWIAYRDALNGKLRKTPASGGAIVNLTDWPQGFGIDWELDEIFIADSDGIYHVSANGGERERLETVTEDSESVLPVARRPDVLPGGDVMLVTVGDFPQGQATALHDLRTGKRSVLLEDAVSASYAPTGHIVFMRDDTLHAVRFDLDRLTLEGAPVPVLEDVHISVTSGVAQYAFSNTGMLAYIASWPEGFRRKLVWVDRRGNIEPIRSFSRRIAGPRISPDGERIALTVFDGTRPEVWLTELARDTLTPMSPGEWNAGIAWSPDGKQIAFSGMTAKGRTVVLEPFNSAGGKVELGPGFNPSWSPDGKTIAYQSFQEGTAHDISIFSFDRERSQPILQEPYWEMAPVISPDGRWLAYISGEAEVAGRARTGQLVYVRSLDNPGEKYQISTDWAATPLWSPDGRELFYRTRESVMRVEIQTAPTFKASPPRALFPDPYLAHDLAIYYPGYDISPDGERFLMVEEEEEPPFPTTIKIILNWFEELERLVPVNH